MLPLPCFGKVMRSPAWGGGGGKRQIQDPNLLPDTSKRVVKRLC